MNGKDSKIGRRELEIIEYLQEKGKETYVQLLVKFAPRPGVFNVVEDRLLRMKNKGLIAIDDNGIRIVRLENIL